MALTPMDIHNKDFKKGFRGYSEDDVDQFLDAIVEEFERLYKENIDLKDRIGLLGDQISQFKTMEGTLKETLITAQRTADEVTATAQKKAELIINEAQGQSQKIIENANKSVFDIQREYLEMKKQAQLYKTKFKVLLQTQLEMMNSVEAADDQPSAEIE